MYLDSFYRKNAYLTANTGNSTIFFQKKYFARSTQGARSNPDQVVLYWLVLDQWF
jgi:hypothetical protein